MKKFLILGLLAASFNAQAIKFTNPSAPHRTLNISHTALALSRHTIGYTIGVRTGLKASGHTDKQINSILSSPAYLASYEASMIEKLQKEGLNNADTNKIIAIWSLSNTPQSYKKLLIRNGYKPQKAHSIVNNIIKKATETAQKTIRTLKNKKRASS